jgi:hypothetical protein
MFFRIIIKFSINFGNLKNNKNNNYYIYINYSNQFELNYLIYFKIIKFLRRLIDTAIWK